MKATRWKGSNYTQMPVGKYLTYYPYNSALKDINLENEDDFIKDETDTKLLENEVLETEDAKDLKSESGELPEPISKKRKNAGSKKATFKISDINPPKNAIDTLEKMVPLAKKKGKKSSK